MNLANQLLDRIASIAPSRVRRVWGELRKWRLTAQRSFIVRSLRFFGYAISFDRYGTIVSPHRIFLPYGLGGPSAFLGKTFVSSKRLRSRETAFALRKARARLLENQETPLSFLQSALLQDGNEKISKLPRLLWYKETHRLCECPSSEHRPLLLVPFSHGYYHEIIEVLSALVSNRSNWCLRLCLDTESKNTHLFSLFKSELGVAVTSTVGRKLVLGHTYRWPDVYPTRDQLTLVRDLFRRHMEARINGFVLLIKRKPSANGRHVINQEMLSRELRRRFATVEEVYLEDLKVEEQVRLFSVADLIVSPHGAGLANLFAASPGCSLIELMPDSDVRWHYFRAAEHLSISSIHIICSTKRGGLFVETNDFCRALDKIS